MGTIWAGTYNQIEKGNKENITDLPKGCMILQAERWETNEDASRKGWEYIIK